MLVWRWLGNIPLVDPVERKLAPLLQLALIALVAALAVALVNAIIQMGLDGLPAGGLLAAGVFVLLCVATLMLVRRGYFKAAAWILLLLIFVLAVNRLAQAVPEKADEALLTFFLPLTIAGAFLGRRVLIGVLVITCILVLIPSNDEKLGASTVAVFILNAALVSFLLDLLGRTLRSELHIALASNQELERAQRALEATSSELFKLNERLTITLKSIGDAVITTDASGRIMLMNNVAEHLTGWTQAEAEGQSLPTVFRIVNEQTRQTVESPADKVIREGVIVGLANHTILLAKDGREIPIDDSGAPIVDGKGMISGVILVFRDIIQRRQAELQEKELIVVKERQRLARELHDSVSQSIFSATVIAASLPSLLQNNPDKALKQIEQLQEMTQGANAEMRTMLLELRPENVSKISLNDLFHQLSNAAQARGRLAISILTQGDDTQALPEAVHFALYRIAQESLNNIVRHGDATQVRLRLKHTVDNVELVIVDNGSGFDVNQTHSGFGLTSMRERAEGIQADLRIQSKPGIGTRVKVVWKPSQEQM